MSQLTMFPAPSFSARVAANVRAESARRGVNQVGLAAILGVWLDDERARRRSDRHEAVSA